MEKKLFLVVLATFLSISIWAQKKIQIQGNLKNINKEKIIFLNYTPNLQSLDIGRTEVAPDSNGNFTASIDAVKGYNWVFLQVGRNVIMLIAKDGTKLQMNADAGKLSQTATYTGKGSEPSSFVIAYTQKYGHPHEYGRRLQSLTPLGPDDFVKGIDSLYIVENAFVEAFSPKLPKDFIENWLDYIRFSNYIAMLNYPAQKAYANAQAQQDNDDHSKLMEVMNNVPKVLNDKYIHNIVYPSYVQIYYNSHLAANSIMDNPALLQSEPQNALARTDSLFSLLLHATPPQSGELAAVQMITNGAKDMPTEHLKKYINAFEKKYPKSNGTKKLKTILNDLIKFEAGQPAIDFEFTTIEGKPMRLSDLKGKVVYLDFWASWCGPCRKEMPFAKQLKDSLTGKDVVFLYVSIDEKEDAWKNGIEKMEIQGMHTRTPGWGGPIAKLYGISGVPAYFLIDKKGNFVIKNAPRPSQMDNLLKLINANL